MVARWGVVTVSVVMNATSQKVPARSSRPTLRPPWSVRSKAGRRRAPTGVDTRSPEGEK